MSPFIHSGHDAYSKMGQLEARQTMEVLPCFVRYFPSSRFS
jgi:hypothetical protein